ncbi:MAG: DNA-binding protein [Lachnospiraceae bacterium]|nr:DNA-binding protein [Lachnospiraceae bacterium]
MEKEVSLKEPKEIVELSYLYDFYGALLKEKHRLIFEDYILNDFSLSEIAEERQMTRQGVYDVVRRCRIKLREYEERLQLVYKFRQTREKLEQIETIARAGGDKEAAQVIARLAEEIYDMI